MANKISVVELFAALKGNWFFLRTLTVRSTGLPIGSVKGEAIFSLLTSQVYHYQEKGTFFSAYDGKALTISREYLYLYDETTDQIALHYAQDGKSTDLFYLLHWSLAQEKQIVAKGAHRCGNDDYAATHGFFFNESGNLKEMSIIYEATGGKDYLHQTHFTKV